MRLTLLRFGDEDYRLVWTFSHAILDGRSFTQLVSEVFAFYEAFCRGEDLQLERPHPYNGYIDWLQEQDWSEAEAYWRNELTGFTAPTPLDVGQTIYNKPADDNPGHGREEAWFSEELTSLLRVFAEQRGVTLNTLLQGAWALLLSRYSGEGDVVFGALRACR